MKVTNQMPPSPQTVERKTGVFQTDPKDAALKARGADGKSVSSDVEISENAKLLKMATDAVKNSPSNNVEKLAQLKRDVQNGTYRVDAKDLADKIVEEHLRTDFGKNSV